MYENITQDQIVLLVRALNTERNIIESMPNSEIFVKQLADIKALYDEASDKDAELYAKSRNQWQNQVWD